MSCRQGGEWYRRMHTFMYVEQAQRESRQGKKFGHVSCLVIIIVMIVLCIFSLWSLPVLYQGTVLFEKYLILFRAKHVVDKTKRCACLGWLLCLLLLPLVKVW